MASAHLIVGLGNPGPKYERTRHNVGFLAIEKLAADWSAHWSAEKKFKARMSRAMVDEKTIHLCQPLRFMNLSGETVGAVSDYFDIATDRMLVLVDDANLPYGELRLRPDGSTGGHNGLGSIEQHLATPDYPRLRIGVGRPSEVGRELSGHVLGKFSAAEWDALGGVLERAALAAECWLRHGAEQAMNEFNRRLELPGQEQDNKDT
jgi:PTH1 family peptidyl-tRNA hydrolase